MILSFIVINAGKDANNPHINAYIYKVMTYVQMLNLMAKSMLLILL